MITDPVTSPEPPSTESWERAERRAVATIIVSIPVWWIEENAGRGDVRQFIRETAINALREIRSAGIRPDEISTPVRVLFDHLLAATETDDFAAQAAEAVLSAAEHFNGETIERRESLMRRPTAEVPAVSELERWRNQLDGPPSLTNPTPSVPPSVRLRGSGHPCTGQAPEAPYTGTQGAMAARRHVADGRHVARHAR